MNQPFFHLIAALSLATGVCAQLPQVGPYSCVTLRSGAGNGITFTAASGPTVPYSAVPFTAADFTAAANGPAAVQVAPYPVWCHSLNADPIAQWISIDPQSTARSTIYSQAFQVPACGVQAASIRFSFCADDWVGDPPSGPNQIGVYVNGQPVPGFGGLGPQTTWTSGAIAPLLQGGTNRLQVYLRDNGGSISGVMYSATICWVGCRSDEVIQLRSGNGSPGGPDSAIKVLAGAPAAPMAMNAANFAAAASGPAAVISASPNYACSQLSVDAQARWISTNLQYGPSSALYSHGFNIAACSVLSAVLSFSCNVASRLGDPLGTPNVGVFLNQNPVPLSFLDGQGGAACNLNVTANIPPSWLMGNGPNTLQVYVRDLGNLRTGVMYSATLTVRPCPPGSQMFTLRSGNGSIGATDSVIRCASGPAAQPLSNAPFTPVDFAAAQGGSQAFVVWNSLWAASLPQDAQAKWVSSTQGPPLTGVSGAPRSAMFAHPFTVGFCRSDLQRAQMVFHYHADDGLGDPQPGGGPNPLGIYLNGIPVPMTAGDISTWPGTYVKTINLGNVAPYLTSGPNVLYVYDRDRNNGVSGVMYSARLVVSPCDWLYYGEPCGNNAPNTYLTAAPTLGNVVEYKVRGDGMTAPQQMLVLCVVGLSDDVGPSGLPLPLDLTPFGATGCQLLASLHLQVFLVTDALGNADMSFPLPNNLAFLGWPLRFQTLALDNASNPLGLSASRGIAVDCRRP